MDNDRILAFVVRQLLGSASVHPRKNHAHENGEGEEDTTKNQY